MESKRQDAPGGYLSWQEVPVQGWYYVLERKWEPEFESVAEWPELVGVVLESVRGWPGGSIEFLEKFPALRAVSIQHPDVKDITPIYVLRGIEYLLLDAPYQKPDFQRLGMLRSLTIRWRKGAESLVECQGLEELIIIGAYPALDLRQLAPLHDLRTLSVRGTKLQAANGIEVFEKLRMVAFVNCSSLANIDAIRAATELRNLEFYSCKQLDDLSPLGELPHLERLLLESCGAIHSVKPLRSSRSLHELYLIGTVVEDGDLGILLDLPRLQKVAIAKDARHSHTSKELNAALSARTG